MQDSGVRWSARAARSPRARPAAGRVVVAAALLAALGAEPARAQPDGVFGAARALYTAARYDEALEALNTLRGQEQADLKTLERYRALCLLALGRAADAEHAIAAVVVADPMYQPHEADTSPRVRAAFADVRRRLLPEIAMARYAAARAVYHQRDWVAAIEQFRLVVALTDDSDAGETLADLRLLASGFLELAARAAEPPPAPARADGSAIAGDTTVAEVSASLPVGVAADPGKVYAAEDTGVVPPVVLRQALPRLPSAATAGAKSRGLLEVVVDEQGRVAAVTVRESIHPAYDKLLLGAALEWKYEPARLDGRAVRFRKLMQISVTR